MKCHGKKKNNQKAVVSKRKGMCHSQNYLCIFQVSVVELVSFKVAFSSSKIEFEE